MAKQLKKTFFLILTLFFTLPLFGEKTYYSLRERVDSEEYFIRGMFHYNNMEYVAAVEFFRKSLDAIPLNEQSRFWLGKSYLMAGYRDLAISEWESLIRLNSADLLLRQKLQHLYTESFMDNQVNLSNSFALLKYYYSATGISALEHDKDHFLYLANFTENQVEVKDANFNTLYTFTNSISKPMDIAIVENLVAISSFGNDKVLIFDKITKNLLFTVGGFGIEKGQFVGPSGIDFQKDLLYVVDSGNNRVQVFRIGKQAQFLLSFGSKGREAGKFLRPTDVVVYQNKIWVADAGNKRIQIFDQSGNYLNQIGEDFLSQPRKLFVKNNKLHILDEEKGLLQWQDKDLTFEVIKSLNQDVQKPIAAQFDNNGLLYFTDFLTDKITVYAPDKMKLSSLRLSNLLTINAGYPNIAIKLRVQDLKGLDIQGLNSSNFKLYHEGKKVENINVYPLKPDAAKLSLVILNRTSSSMQKYKKEIYDYFRQITKGIHFNDRIAILNYANSLTEAQPFTNQSLSLLEKLEKTTYENLTNDAFDTTLHQAITKNLNNEFYNGIVILEDGKSNTDFKKYSPEVLASYAKANGIPIFIIAMDEGPLTPHLKYLAKESGGKYLSFFKSNEIFDLFSIIKKNQPLFYLLTYQSPLYQRVNRFVWLNLFIELDYKGLYGAEKTGFFIP